MNDDREKKKEERKKLKEEKMRLAAFFERLKRPGLAEKLMAEPKPMDPRDYSPAPLAPDLASATVKADDIPVVHTPRPRYKKFPAPILADCDEPLPEGVPDLRGVWEVYEGALKGHIERIEQCGNRVIITGGYTIHDMRADGTLEHGVNDINELTGQEIHVSALFEDGRLYLHPNGKKVIAVSRWLEGDELVWRFGPFMNRLRRLKAPPKS